jgi:hypothetical protein
MRREGRGGIPLNQEEKYGNMHGPGYSEILKYTLK